MSIFEIFKKSPAKLSKLDSFAGLLTFCKRRIVIPVLQVKLTELG